MIGMGHAGRVIVCSHPAEGLGTVPIFMDMHGKKGAIAGVRILWKVEKFCLHQDAFIRGRVKFYQAAEGGVSILAPHPGQGFGSLEAEQIGKGVSRSSVLFSHKVSLS